VNPSVVFGAAYPNGSEIASALAVEGGVVTTAGLDASQVATALAGLQGLNAAVIVCPPPRLGLRFLEIGDEHLDATLNRFLDVISTLQMLLPRMAQDSAIVAITSRGYLGAWGGVHEMAFAGADVALFRCVALENMGRIRANVVVVDIAPGPGAASDVAEIVTFLASPNSVLINGETVLATAGRSLMMREARDRRVPSAAASQMNNTRGRR
jgi:hypothetical protein